MGRFLKGQAFDLGKVRAAEARYNNSVVRSDHGDESALAEVVQEHVARYPHGIDPQHARTNGFDHAADAKRQRPATNGRAVEGPGGT